jgi:hypothetical protein
MLKPPTSMRGWRLRINVAIWVPDFVKAWWCMDQLDKVACRFHPLAQLILGRIATDSIHLGIDGVEMAGD